MPTQPITFEEAVEQAISRDPRYQPEAYAFVRDALHVAATKFCTDKEDKNVSGQELLEGVRLHALQEFGPMAWFLLQEWGVLRGEDVGRIVYNLIEIEYFGKKDEDSIHDFSGGYDFETAFTQPFLPSSRAQSSENPNS
jgi:uncharacterized repeat protein (TIGR04138 family)